MKYFATAALCLFLAFTPRAQHVILISIDGFRPEMYQDPCCPAPNLHWPMTHGTYARHLKSVFPSYTYPSHTAMITGGFPARSKILHNQPRNNPHGEWNWFMDSVKVPMIWGACEKAGLTTAAVEWPVAVGKDIDYDVPKSGATTTRTGSLDHGSTLSPEVSSTNSNAPSASLTASP